MIDSGYVLETGIISGTDIGAILGCNPHNSAYDVWNKRKNGEAKPIPENMQEYVEWGIRLEDMISKKYADDNDVKVRESEVIKDGYKSGSPDRLVKSREGVRWGLEIKTNAGPTWSEPPEHYVLQCRWYMMLTNLNRWDLACLFRGSEYKQWTITRDLDIERNLVKLADAFYNEYIAGDNTPFHVERIKSSPEPIRSDNIDALWDEYKKYKEDEKLAKSNAERVKQQIFMEADNNSEIEGDRVHVKLKKTFRKNLNYVKLSEFGINREDLEEPGKPYVIMSGKYKK